MKYTFISLLLFVNICFAQEKKFEAKKYKMESIKGQEIICPAGTEQAHTFVDLPEKVKAYLSNPSARIQNAPKKSKITVTYVGFPTDAQNAFEQAVAIWEAIIESSVEINVLALWQPLGKNILGSASPYTFFRNFPGAKANDVWYPIALAEKLYGSDLNGPDAPDIVARFSSEQDWYFGLTGTPANGQFHFATVILHELGHGLGMVGSMSVDGTEGSYGFFGDGVPSIYDNDVLYNKVDFLVDTSKYENPSAKLKTALTSNNIYFYSKRAKEANKGEPARLYCPASFKTGSSIYHLDDFTYQSGNTNSLMTSNVQPGEVNLNPGPIVEGMLGDMGWAGTNVVHKPKKDVAATNEVKITGKVFTDVGIKPGASKLYYLINSNSGADLKEVAMTLNGDEISGVIPISVPSADVLYFFEVVDNNNDTIKVPASSPAFVNGFSVGKTDTYSPTVENYPFNIVLANQPLTVLANVDDNFENGVSEVSLAYEVNGGSSKTIKLKKFQKGVDDPDFSQGYRDDINYFNSSEFGNFAVGDKVTYQIIAKDINGNTTVFPQQMPADAGQNTAPVPSKYELTATSVLEKKDSYKTDFESNSSDFATIGFSIGTVSGYNSKVLHSTNPYTNGLGSIDPISGGIYQEFTKNEIALLRYRIKLTSDTALAKIVFDEVVLVEPGQDGVTDYTDSDFYDYVIVEGSLDGGSWFPFETGYDSRTKSTFLNIYNSGFSGFFSNSTGKGSAALQSQRVINIYGSDYASALVDSAIFIRFRLNSDLLSAAWGWSIDNLVIQQVVEEVLAEEPALNQDNFLVVSPNPSKEYINVKLNVNQSPNIEINLYSMEGKIVYTKNYLHNSGPFETKISTLNLVSGTYMLQAKTREGMRVKRILVTK